MKLLVTTIFIFPANIVYKSVLPMYCNLCVRARVCMCHGAIISVSVNGNLYLLGYVYIIAARANTCVISVRFTITNPTIRLAAIIKVTDLQVWDYEIEQVVKPFINYVYNQLEAYNQRQSVLLSAFCLIFRYF